MHPPTLRAVWARRRGRGKYAKTGRWQGACPRAVGEALAGMAESAAGAVDFGYLEGFMAGDRKVVGEVLTVFLEQARLWEPKLSPDAADWRDVVHTIKGAGRGIGANALGDVCAQAEGQGEA